MLLMHWLQTTIVLQHMGGYRLYQAMGLADCPPGSWTHLLLARRGEAVEQYVGHAGHSFVLWP